MSPWQPKKPCASPGCPKLTSERFCEAHAKQEQKRYDSQRGKTAERGYGWAWQKRRRRWLQEHPLCVDCEKEDRVTAAIVVDHIIPKSRGGADDESNYQSLCKHHHDCKTARERGHKGRGG